MNIKLIFFFIIAFNLIHSSHSDKDLTADEISKRKQFLSTLVKGDVCNLEKIIKQYKYLINVQIRKSLLNNELKLSALYPLHISVMNNNLKVTRLLLENNADVHVKRMDGYTPFHDAMVNGFVDIAQYLYSYDSSVIKDVTDIGCSALHLSVCTDSSAMVEWLLKLKEDIFNPNFISNGLCTSLHWALQNRISEYKLMNLNKIIKLLLKYKANINALDQQNQTPLLIASAQGFYIQSQILLNEKADINLVNNEGYSPLFIAVNKDHVDLTLMLLERGANFEQRSNSGYNVFHAAAVKETDKMFDNLLDTRLVKLEQKRKLLLGADSPLFIIARLGKISLMNKLITLFDDLFEIVKNLKSLGSENSLVHIATRADHLEMIKYLVNDLKMDVNAVNVWGDTPLHIAVMNGSIATIACLRALGANPSAENKEGKNAFQLISPSLTQAQKKHMSLLCKKEKIEYEGNGLVGPVGCGNTCLEGDIPYSYREEEDTALEHSLTRRQRKFKARAIDMQNLSNTTQENTTIKADNIPLEIDAQANAEISRNIPIRENKEKRDRSLKHTRVLDESVNKSIDKSEIEKNGIPFFGRPVLYDKEEVDSLDPIYKKRVYDCFKTLEEYGLRATDAVKLQGLKKLNFWRIDIGLYFRIVISFNGANFIVEGMGLRDHFYEKFFRRHQ